MDLELTDEQTWLAESVEQLLAKSSWERSWPELIEFGALAIAAGADGLGAVELVLVGRAIGQSLASVPFSDSAAARYATRPIVAQGHSRFAALHAGDDAVALCLLEPGTGWELALCTTTVTRGAGASELLDGQKLAVQHAARADQLLVLYVDAEERRIALIDRQTAGIEIAPAESIDESVQTAVVELTGVELPVGGGLSAEQSELVLARLLAIGGLLAASEAVGAAGKLVQLASAYAAERRQFGRSIASFQALRHLLADMYVKQTSAWSTVLFAAAALEDEIHDAGRTAAIAKAYSSRATLEVAHGALQVFGGIAFTAEHSAHRYLRRILACGGRFGDAAHHERQIGRALAAAARHKELVA